MTVCGVLMGRMDKQFQINLVTVSEPPFETFQSAYSYGINVLQAGSGCCTPDRLPGSNSLHIKAEVTKSPSVYLPFSVSSLSITFLIVSRGRSPAFLAA